jgi:hypothetical protein
MASSVEGRTPPDTPTEGETLECVCGCGTEVPKRLMPTNLVAFIVMTELAEWDRFRFNMSQAGLDFEESSPTNVFIDDGAFCYERSLRVLHGELLHSTPRDTKKWMKFSRKSRKKIAKKYPGLIEGSKEVEITDELRFQVDRQHPDRSYTGLDGDEARQAAERMGWPSLAEENGPAADLVDEPLTEGEKPINDTGVMLADLERKYGTASTDDDR